MSQQVVCLYCKEKLEKDSEECVKVNARRYAHKSCYENRDPEVIAKEILLKKTKEWFGNSYNPQKINAQLKKYLNEGKTIANIVKALEYFYEVKGNNPVESNGGIGIIPYVYEESMDYWVKGKEKEDKFAKIIFEPPEEKKIQLKRQPVTKPVNLEFFELR